MQKSKKMQKSENREVQKTEKCKNSKIRKS
jgi:hypothetical protein